VVDFEPAMMTAAAMMLATTEVRHDKLLNHSISIQRRAAERPIRVTSSGRWRSTRKTFNDSN
jgi:hypothetical protein